MEQGAQGNVAGRVQGIASAMRDRWSALPPAQRRLFLTCVLALAALGGVAGWWSSRTDWRTLFSGLENRDAAQVAQQLSAAGIVYQSSPDGTAIEVPAEELDKARVAVAAKGMPQSGRLGFELFDKPNWVGSEFDERVNYQRALEGELEHTIETMEAIRSARVHIVLARRGAFSSEDQPAKASVVLKLRRQEVQPEQAEGIRSLIAGAVEGLQPSQVTLVDAAGRADLSGHAHGDGMHEEENAMEQKLIAMLEPLAGPGNVHATVNISTSDTSEEHTDEVYDPTQAVPVSVQKSEGTAQTTRAAGVAGVASNTPAAVPANASGTPAAGMGPSNAQTQTTRQETSSYAVTRHLSHTEAGPGRVRRVAAAIVVNDRQVSEGAGKSLHTAWKPRTAEEMHRMELLAQAAVGYESKRGDTVALENVAFTGNGAEAQATLFEKVSREVHDLLRSQPSLLRTLATGVALLLVGTMVLRPLVRQAIALLNEPQKALPAPPAPLPVLQVQTVATAAGTAPAAITAPMEAASLLPEGTDVQTIFDRVTRQVKTSPQSSTRLVESWMNAGEEAEA